MKTKIVLTGNYFVGNVGDNLLFDSVSKELSAYDVELMIPHGSDSQAGAYWLMPAGFKSFFGSLLKGRLFKTIGLLKRSDILLFGGGGLLNCEVPRSLLIWGVQIITARIFKTKVVMLGQSFPKYNLVKSKRLFRFLLNMCSLITVRDHTSYKVASELVNDKVILKETADLALTREYETNSESTDEILINFRSYKNLDDENLLNFANKILSFLINNSEYNLSLFGMDSEDYNFIDRILDLLPSGNRVRVLKYDSDLDLIKKFGSAAAIISMRLHGCVLAALNQKPLFGLAYNDKNVGFIEQLEFNTVPMVDLRDEMDLDEPELVSRLQEFLKNINLGVSLEAQLKKLRAKSQLNFTYLSGWLDD